MIKKWKSKDKKKKRLFIKKKTVYKRGFIDSMFWIGAFYLFKSSSCPMLFYRQDVSYYKWIFFKRCVGHIDCLQSRHQCCLLPNCPWEGDCTERGNELIVSVERVLERLLFVGKSELIDYLFHNCGLWQECSCASSEDRLKEAQLCR